MIKNNLIIIYLILFISSFVYSQNDGQPPLFINIDPIETYYNNSTIELETQVTDVSTISKVILYYKFSEDNGYSSIIMNQDINYFGTIPSSEVYEGKMEYYFFAEDVYGNQSYYPKDGEVAPLSLNINNTLDDNIYQNIEINLLEPIDKSHRYSIPIIIISLYSETGNINLNDISIIIDNQDITSNCVLDANMITYLPSKLFSTGEHYISVLFKSKGIKYTQRDFSFIIKKQIKETTFSVINLKEQFNIKSSFGYDSDFDEYYDKERPDNRPLDTHKLNGRLSFRFGNYKFKISSLFTGYLLDEKFQDDKLLKQPIDRLKFSLQSEDLIIKYGDHSSEFSSLTLKGVRVRGFHSSYETDNVKTSFVMGNLKEPIQSYYNFNSDSTGWIPIVLGYDSTYYDYTKGTPTRELSAFRTEINHKDKLKIGLSMLSAYDVLSGIDIWTPSLYDEYELLGNAVAGMDFTIFMNNKKTWIKGETALSITNNLLDSTDIIIDTLNISETTLVDYENILGFPITNDAVLGTAEGRGISAAFPNLDTSGDPIIDMDYIFNELIRKGTYMFSFKSPIELQGNKFDFQGSYRHIPPNFVSFGSGSIQKDIEGIKSSLKIKLLDNQLSVNLGFDNENDNLLGEKATEKLKSTTTNTQSTSFGFGLYFNSLSKLEHLVKKITNWDAKVKNIPTINYSLKMMGREGLDVFSDSLTTSSTTISHTITPAFKFNFNNTDINVNGNILLMSFIDDFSIDTASTNYKTNSFSGGASLKIKPPISLGTNSLSFNLISPLSINIGGGYSANIPEDNNKKPIIFKLFNTKIAYKFFEKKLSSFMGVSFVKGFKDADLFSPKVDNLKATFKIGLQYKIWENTSIAFNVDYLIIDDTMDIENSYSELKGKFKLKVAL